MTTTFEIRTSDLAGVFIWFDTKREAIDYWLRVIKDLPATDLRHGAVVVEKIMESPAEAETARLNYLLSPGSLEGLRYVFSDFDQVRNQMSPEDWQVYARQAIDTARQAPPKTVKVICPLPPGETEA